MSDWLDMVETALAVRAAPTDAAARDLVYEFAWRLEHGIARDAADTAWRASTFRHGGDTIEDADYDRLLRAGMWHALAGIVCQDPAAAAERMRCVVEAAKRAEVDRLAKLGLSASRG